MEECINAQVVSCDGGIAHVLSRTNVLMVASGNYLTNNYDKLRFETRTHKDEMRLGGDVLERKQDEKAHHQREMF